VSLNHYYSIYISVFVTYAVRKSDTGVSNCRCTNRTQTNQYKKEENEKTQTNNYIKIIKQVSYSIPHLSRTHIAFVQTRRQKERKRETKKQRQEVEAAWFRRGEVDLSPVTTTTTIARDHRRRKINLLHRSVKRF
jgi:hypothetical protein